tara:strand:- start:928 stop:1386 length:459 start_codon:yes stop_codon:yes gene_type:complete
MATTVSKASLVVTVTEQITLNGTIYDQNTTKTITGVTGYDKSIFTLSSGVSHNVAEFVSLPSGDKHDVENLRYLRVTNLDDTNNIVASFASSSASAGLNMTAGSTAVLFDGKVSGIASKSPITTTANLDTVYLHNPHNSGVDIELVVASRNR